MVELVWRASESWTRSLSVSFLWESWSVVKLGSLVDTWDRTGLKNSMMMLVVGRNCYFVRFNVQILLDDD